MTDNQTINPVEGASQQSVPEDKAQQYLDNWKRAAADLDNYRKDESRRIADVLKFGNERIILDVLDIADNLDTALTHAPPDCPQDWLQGIQQVRKQLAEFLKKHGVEKIPAVGKPFDPALHEAVAGQGEAVAEEFRAGYTMHGRVIRPARVKLGIN